MLRSVINLVSKQKGWRTFTSSVSTTENNVNREFTIFNKLQTEFQDVSYIKSKLNHEQLKNTTIEQWRSCIGMLREFHLSDSQCFQMISKSPELIAIPSEELEQTMKTWLACGMSISSLRQAFISQPSLLDVEKSEIERRVPYLQSLFSRESLCQLLSRCPNVMFEDWIDIQNKIHFLLNVKGIRNEKLLKSYALTQPLDFIKLRFDIAEKCGKYVRISLKAHKRVKFDKTNNVGIGHLIDDSDEDFARKMKITLEEYRVCEELFQLDETQNDVDDDNDFDEDDGNGYYPTNRKKDKRKDK